MSCNTCQQQSAAALQHEGVSAQTAKAVYARPGNSPTKCPYCGQFMSADGEGHVCPGDAEAMLYEIGECHAYLDQRNVPDGPILARIETWANYLREADIHPGLALAVGMFYKDAALCTDGLPPIELLQENLPSHLRFDPIPSSAREEDKDTATLHTAIHDKISGMGDVWEEHWALETRLNIMSRVIVKNSPENKKLYNALCDLRERGFLDQHGGGIMFSFLAETKLLIDDVGATLDPVGHKQQEIDKVEAFLRLLRSTA